MTIDDALARASKQQWNNGLSHVDIEQCFLDRATLALAVYALREKLLKTEEDLHVAEREAGYYRHELHDSYGIGDY